MRRIFIFLGSLLMATGFVYQLMGPFSFSHIGASVHESAIKTYDLIKETTVPAKEKTVGLLMFRGNETRTFYGTGPLAETLTKLWSYPKKPLCGDSTVGGITKQWCGNGWTGQPAVWERKDGITEVIFGAYDKQIHFLNAATGEETRQSFPTADIIKGSVTIDPDGFPLLYTGSRDNKLRIIALDQTIPTELWNLDADKEHGIWNNDWDGNPLIKDDLLFEGGENGWFYVYKLNRSYNEAGFVTVNPTLLFKMPSYNDELIARIGRNVGIENSVVLSNNTIYFANSGGRILGVDVRNITEGKAPIVFDFWAGDDIDATLVADEKGMIYGASEEERLNPRSKEIGQLFKLDPKNKENPLVWSIKVPAKGSVLGGAWATPALYKDFIYAQTNPGELYVINKETGVITATLFIGAHSWSSPVIVDEKMLIASCQGVLSIYSLSDPSQPTLLSQQQLDSQACIESTPAVWKGQVFFGARDGFIYSFK